MEAFFQTIIGFVEVVFEYFINFVETLIMATTFLATSMNTTLFGITYLPPIIGSMVAITIAVFVVRFLLLK